MRVAYNTAKRRALEALATEPGRAWLVPELAARAGLLPRRRAYTYLLRLWRMKLVDRGRWGQQVVYRITPTGLRRLAWLRARGVA